MEPGPAGDSCDKDHYRPHLRVGCYSFDLPACTTRNPAAIAFFGDGCVRLQQPLSPVIRLGAEKVFAIGVRCENLEHHKEPTDERDPSLAQVMGIIFNVMFLDHLATDIEHLERLNQRLSNGHIIHPGIEGYEELRPLTSLLMTPSVALSQLAEQHQRDIPYLIQYFVSSLGRDAASCADLMSYLLFASKYTRALIDIGYDDASQRIDEIESFLYSTDAATKNPPARIVGKNKSRRID